MPSAIYPGSFDPFTYGHLDVIKRALKIFDRLFVVVAENASKESFFTKEERIKMIREAVKPYKKVSVDYYNGLVVGYAKKKNVKVILRGIRNYQDFGYEFQMSLANKKLNGDIETIFVAAQEETLHINSQLIKEIASCGGDLSKFVPKVVEKALLEKFK